MKTAEKSGTADREPEKVAVDFEEELQLVSHLERRGAEEDKLLPDILYSFCLQMQTDPTKKKSYMAYVKYVKQLMEVHRRAATAMVSEEYLRIVKSLPRNKTKHNQLSAAIVAFQRFMSGRVFESPWDKAPSGDKLYVFGVARTKIASTTGRLAKSSVDGNRAFMATLCETPPADAKAAGAAPTSPSNNKDWQQNEPPTSREQNAAEASSKPKPVWAPHAAEESEAGKPQEHLLDLATQVLSASRSARKRKATKITKKQEQNAKADAELKGIGERKAVNVLVKSEIVKDEEDEEKDATTPPIDDDERGLETIEQGVPLNFHEVVYPSLEGFVRFLRLQRAQLCHEAGQHPLSADPHLLGLRAREAWCALGPKKQQRYQLDAVSALTAASLIPWSRCRRQANRG